MSSKVETIAVVACVEPSHFHGAVIDHIKMQILSICKEHGLETASVDYLRIPGPDRIPHAAQEFEVQAIRHWLEMLSSVHHITSLAVIGHEGCAGHPIDEEQRPFDITASANFLSEHFPQYPVLGFHAARVRNDTCTLTHLCTVKK